VKRLVLRALAISGATFAILLALFVTVYDPWTWAWGLYAQGEHETRLITRLRVRVDSKVSSLLMDLFEVVMTSKFMLGIERRVEVSSSGRAVAATQCADLGSAAEAICYIAATKTSAQSVQ